MNKRYPFALTIVLSALLAWPYSAYTEEAEADKEAWAVNIAGYPFRPGEKLTFTLHWSVVKVGQVTMETSGPEVQDGEQCLHFHLSARTSGIVDKVYKVKTDIHGWADSQMHRTLHFIKKQKEGKTDRDIVVDYDWPKKQLVYANWGEAMEPLALGDRAFDPLTAVYYCRTLKLEVGKVYEFPVTDGKKLITGKVTVLAREKIRTSFGMVDCFKIQPELKDIGGVFKKSKNASMYVWLSADRYKFPVKLKSEVKVGSFHAELRTIELPGVEGLPEDFACEEIPRARRRSGGRSR